MYKTVTVWIESKGKKLEFQSDEGGAFHWISVDNEASGGNVSFHFDADGLRQFIFALEGLERSMKEGAEKIDEAKEEVVNNG